MIRELESITTLNFDKFIKLKVDGACNCDRYCIQEGICRAFSISSVEIEKINIQAIAEFIWNKINKTNSREFKRDDKIKRLLMGYDSKFEIYCIERILSNYKLWDISNWEYTYINGYYGHEVDSLLLDETIGSRILLDIEKVIELQSFKDKVEFLLFQEYGFILETLTNCRYEIKRISRNDLYFPQTRHLEIVKKNDWYLDRKRTSIMGICIEESGRFRVVDGYNRLSQTNHKMVTIITAKNHE